MSNYLHNIWLHLAPGEDKSSPDGTGSLEASVYQKDLGVIVEHANSISWTLFICGDQGYNQCIDSSYKKTFSSLAACTFCYYIKH